MAAFTLIELLLVISIMAVLLGLSAGAYWRMSSGFKEQGAASQLDLVLRQTRISAILANAPAFVEVDKENRRMTPWAYRTVGLWHFEDRDMYGKSSGARGIHFDAVMRGAELYPDGKIGKCAKMAPAACIELGSSNAF